MTRHPPSADDILAGFAIAYRRDASALGTWCLEHPDLVSELVDLAHELALQEVFAGDAPLDAATERWIETATSPSPALANPFAGLGPQDYGALRHTLGVPSIVLNAFRDRLVAAGTVPLAFLGRLADGLGTGMRELAQFLAGPQTLARATSHKADGTPAALPEKISFAALLDEAGVPPERAAELLAED